MPRDADIVVIGAGIVGAATAQALSERAGSVVLLEQFDVGHERGSSHGSSRIFRLNYPDERFVRLAQAADAAWTELERDRGERLIERLGSIDVGPVAADVGRALAACGIAYEILTSVEAESRWPIRLDADETAVFQADGGFLHAERAHAALLATATERGVEVRAGTPVRELTLESGAVRLTLDRGELLTRAVVVTAGAWAPALLSSAGIGLAVVPTCETVVYLDLPTAETIPPVIDYGRLPSPEQTGISRVGQAAYALPAPGRGLKAGLHHSGPAVDPDGRQTTDERVAAWVQGWASDRYYGVGQVLATEACLYTNTADEGFVLERHGRVVVGSACSGHGFKFAPVVGRTLAALAREAAA